MLVYAMRCVNCPQCGVVVERIPRASGKNQQTNLWSSADQKQVARAGTSVQLRAAGNNWETAADGKIDFDTKNVLITLTSNRILR